MKKDLILKEIEEEKRSLEYHKEQIEFIVKKIEWLSELKDK